MTGSCTAAIGVEDATVEDVAEFCAIDVADVVGGVLGTEVASFDGDAQSERNGQREKYACSKLYGIVVISAAPAAASCCANCVAGVRTWGCENAKTAPDVESTRATAVVAVKLFPTARRLLPGLKRSLSSSIGGIRYDVACARAWMVARIRPAMMMLNVRMA